MPTDAAAVLDRDTSPDAPLVLLHGRAYTLEDALVLMDDPENPLPQGWRYQPWMVSELGLRLGTRYPHLPVFSLLWEASRGGCDVVEAPLSAYAERIGCEVADVERAFDYLYRKGLAMVVEDPSDGSFVGYFVSPRVRRAVAR